MDLPKQPKILVYVDEDLREMIPRFLENRMRDVLSLETALKESAFHKIRTLGHDMKGMGAGYGFEEITDIGHQLEEAALQKETEAIHRAVKRLKDYLTRVEVVYKKNPEVGTL